MEKLVLTPAGFKTWKLVKDFEVEINGERIIVTKGSKTDLASVPQFLWCILPPFGRYSQASVIHDFLYRSRLYSRRESDEIFYELMLRYGTYKWKAKLMYVAVRLFGWAHYG